MTGEVPAAADCRRPSEVGPSGSVVQAMDVLRPSSGSTVVRGDAFVGGVEVIQISKDYGLGCVGVFVGVGGGGLWRGLGRGGLESW